MLSFLRELLSRPAPEEHALPPELPVLAVRNAVLFPGAVRPFIFGRARSVALLDTAASLPGGFVAVFAQRDPMTEEPGIEDLHPVGVAARILERARQDEAYEVVLHGHCRIRAVHIQHTEPFLVATPEQLCDTVRGSAPDRALVSEVRELAKRAATFHLESASRAHDLIDGISAPSALADFVAANVEASVADQALLLANLGPITRLEQVYSLIAREVERLEAGGPGRDDREQDGVVMAWSQD